MGKKLHLVSLGCTKNLVDSEVMLGRMREYEIVDDASEADVLIVNTCGFIEAAKEESIAAIFELNEKRKEGSKLVVSGCLSERYRETLEAEMPEVDIFTGVGDYDRVDEMVLERKSIFSPRVFLADDSYARLITGSAYHAYIKIAEGCNQTCSFCAIPSFKGRLQSRSADSILRECERLSGEGYFDISFISQDSSSFGRDRGEADGLLGLIENMERVSALRSARILYLYPSTLSKRVISAIAGSELFRTYYDMPIQHIDDRMLKLMKRGFGEKKTIDLLEAMRTEKDSFVRTSVIAGHPGETEESFKRLCGFLEEFAFDRINVFAFSNEEDTLSYGMEQLPNELIEERTGILADIAARSMERSLDAMVGKEMDLVVDGVSDEHDLLLSARPLDWAPEIDGEVLVNDSGDIAIEPGTVYMARITERAGEKLLARIEGIKSHADRE